MPAVFTHIMCICTIWTLQRISNNLSYSLKPYL